jgi:hypothetical protein
MLANECVTKNVTSCTPSGTIGPREASENPRYRSACCGFEYLRSLLEGMITDRDLCCSVVASPKDSCAVRVGDLMTRFHCGVFMGF